MTKSRRKIIRYSTCFKLQVVEEIEKNELSIADCRRKYNIAGGQTIQNWLRKYGKNHLLNKVIRIETMDERDELKRLGEEVKALKPAYAKLSLKHTCSKTVIEVADEMFNLELKKSMRKSCRSTQRRQRNPDNRFIRLFWNFPSELL